MSFSSELRAELARIQPHGKKAVDTAAATLLANLCRLSAGEDGSILILVSSDNFDALKKFFTLIQKNVNIKPDLFLGKKTPQPVPPDLAEYLRGLQILSGESGSEGFGKTGGEKTAEASGNSGEGSPAGPAGGNGGTDFPDPSAEQAVRLREGVLPQGLLKGPQARVYLREMFLCTGFMSDPKRRYHLEFRCFSGHQAEQLCRVIGEQGFHAGLTRRKSYHVVYMKDSEDIAGLLQLMGANVTLMATENARILKGIRNTVNRRVNCETANIGKTVVSATRQLEDIRLLHQSGTLQTLPAQLREAADLRENHPGASLSELGALANPPVGRSGMNHRMRKLSALADQVRERAAEAGSSALL